MGNSSSRPSSLSPHYHKGHASGSPHAVWAEAWTPQTTSLPGRLTEVRTPKDTTRLWRQVCWLALGRTVADRSELASGDWAFSLAPSGSQPQAQ